MIGDDGGADSGADSTPTDFSSISFDASSGWTVDDILSETILFHSIEMAPLSIYVHNIKEVLFPFSFLETIIWKSEVKCNEFIMRQF